MHFARIVTAAAVFASLVSGSSATRAQMAGPLKTEPERSPGWVFTPSLGVGGSWDDNVLLVNPGDLPPSDYASPINPSLSLDFTGRRLQLSTGYDGSIVLYRSLDELSSFEHNLRAFVEGRVTRRLTLFGQETLAIAPTTDALLLHGGVPFYRVGSRTNAIGGGAVIALQKHMSMRGAYTLRSVRFDFDERAGRELQGGHAHEFDVSVERALSPRLSVGGEYEFDRVRVGGDDPATPLEPGFADRFNIQGGHATVRYQLLATTQLSGAVGISHLGAGRTHGARTAPSYRAAITHRVERATVTAGYRRSYIPSFGFGGTFQNEEWTANVNVPFASNRAYVDGGVSWFDNDALEPGQPSLRSTWLTGKVGYRLTPWLRMEGFYSRAQQDTQRAGGRLSRNQVGFQIVTAKPFRLQY